MEQLLILGAGGLGRVAAETAEAAGYEVFFLDDAARGAKVVGRCMDYADLKDRFQSVGRCAQRSALFA